MHVQAQEKNISDENDTVARKTIVRPDKCPTMYITTSTGINNNTALIGFSFDVPVSKYVSVEAGPGAGTWNTKLYAGVKYYTKPCHRGFAIGVGLAYCTGLNHDQHSLETIYGNNESILYNKNPQTNVLFMVYKYWDIGKKYNRFYVESGWSTPINGGDKITQLSGDPLSEDAISRLGSSIQQGPILAVGISFGIY